MPPPYPASAKRIARLACDSSLEINLPLVRESFMSFKCEILRVFIASPSDLTEERQAATEAVNDWNAQHAIAESVVLLPVKWETHAAPQAGMRPQKAINEQLV